MRSQALIFWPSYELPENKSLRGRLLTLSLLVCTARKAHRALSARGQPARELQESATKTMTV